MLNCKLIRFKSKGVGKLGCRICGINFETKINNLFAQADVYCAWMDELDRLENERKVLEQKEKEKYDKEREKNIKKEEKIENKIEKEDESSDDENYYNHKKSESQSSFNDEESENDSLVEEINKVNKGRNLKKLKNA